MSQEEPPSPRSCSKSSLFLIGKDSHGHWVAQDQRGLRGGLFVNRAEALKFALFENGNRPQAIEMIPGVLELNMSRQAGQGHHLSATIDAARERRVA
jgi:hypothetical protein